MTEVPAKICKTCGTKKDEKEFPFYHKRTYRIPHCILCKREKDRVWEANKRLKTKGFGEEALPIPRIKATLTAPFTIKCIDCGTLRDFIRTPPLRCVPCALEQDKLIKHAEYKRNISKYKKSRKEKYIKFWNVEENRISHSAKTLDTYYIIKQLVFNHYGNKCNCCGEDSPWLFTLDHVNNDGFRERKEFGRGITLYRRVIKLNFPPNYQILCWNCNCGKSACGGVCPHQHTNFSNYYLDRMNSSRNKYTFTLREAVLTQYGQLCANCGESHRGFLTLDHVNNDGAKQRKLGLVGSVWYKYIIANNFPPDFQVLCYNCNCTKTKVRI